MHRVLNATRRAQSADRAGFLIKTEESGTGGEDVVKNFEYNGCLFRIQSFQLCKLPSPVPLYHWIIDLTFD